jgi:hypothetical protein
MFKFVAALVVLTAAVTTWWVESGRYSPSERDLFGRVEAATKGGPSTAALVREFRLPAECASRTCLFEPSDVGRTAITSGNIRHPSDGIIFELEGLGGDCISTTMARNWFGGRVAQRCVDSVCYYLESKREWGTISFGVDRPDSACVSSVVINSAR